MEPFLKIVAQFLDKTFGADLENICVVLPNRRAGLFLRQHLAAVRFPAVSWSPAILSIEDFFNDLSGLREVDLITQLVELYKAYVSVEGNAARTFEQYLEWSRQLLRDFNEIDQNLVDSNSLFSSVSEARAISLWNPDGTPLTPFQLEYLRFFQSLKHYHKAFASDLISQRLGTQGLIFRRVAENISHVKDNMAWKHVIFAGCNALTKAEEKVIEFLRNEGVATLLWDADRYYLDDEMQEAGSYLRKWLSKWPVKETRWVADNFSDIDHHIRIIGLPDQLGQAKYCGSVLQELAAAGSIDEKTAVVLMDVSALFAVLNAVPACISEINVTAGFPLIQSPLAAFFEDMFNLQIHAGRYSKFNQAREKKFHYADVLKLLQNPYTRLIVGSMNGGKQDILDSAIDRIRKGLSVFIGFRQIAKDESNENAFAFLEPVFQAWNSPEILIAAIRSVLVNIRSSIRKTRKSEISGSAVRHFSFDNSLELEFIAQFEEIINQLSVVGGQLPGDVTLPVFHQLFRQVLAGKSLPFSGEPLKGLQIMGLLETRGLDFDNVIVLSCNEDLLPAARSNSSFIPFDIRQAFELSTHRQADAVQAYHFYRLLQRAGNIWLLHITQSGPMGGGDRSRFLRQLSAELPKFHPGQKIEDVIVTMPTPDSWSNRSIEVEKTDLVNGLLKAKAEKGYSASSLNIYRTCPLKFYYSEIAGIREPEEIADTIDAPVLGNAVHKALHVLYKPLINKMLTVSLLNDLLKESEPVTLKAFEEKLKGADMLSGKNLLLVNVAKMLVKKLIRHDIQIQEDFDKKGTIRQVSLLEHYLETSVTLSVNQLEIRLKLKGILDRVDRINGNWIILDYKTGLTEAKNVRIKDWSSLASDSKLNIGFQLLMYNELLQACNDQVYSSSAGIISLRKISAGFLPVSVPAAGRDELTDQVDRETLKNFRGILMEILSEIYNTDIPFIQTTDVAKCKNCPYINLCAR
jgi:CRISPR/Cas system-associated exonuclease Cas4 (RecB family)